MCLIYPINIITYWNALHIYYIDLMLVLRASLHIPYILIY